LQRSPTSVGKKIKNTVFFGRTWKTRSAGISPAYLNTSHESRFKIDPPFPTRVKKRHGKSGSGSPDNEALRLPMPPNLRK